VEELKKQGVDGIKSVLEGRGSFVRMDPALLRAIAEGARAAGLPIVCHTGDSRDIADALDAGINGIEHGSLQDAIPEAVLARMKQAGVSYDPTLAVYEALLAIQRGKTDLLDRSLVQQVAPPSLLQGTRKTIPSLGRRSAPDRAQAVEFGKQNLLAAMHAGVLLVTGTDSGNLLVVHGPGIHRELQLWVEGGVPPAVALQAATYNGARLLRADQRIGLIRKGYEASLLLVDGNPLQDISATERISMVMFKGERVDRTELLKRQ
jgi:imidazolonepropionase-like amidohydrolase